MDTPGGRERDSHVIVANVGLEKEPMEVPRNKGGETLLVGLLLLFAAMLVCGLVGVLTGNWAATKEMLYFFRPEWVLGLISAAAFHYFWRTTGLSSFVRSMRSSSDS